MAGSLSTDPGGGECKSWAELQRDVLGVILNELILPDFIRFCVVCKSWLSVTLDHKHKRMETINQQVPMLMIPQEGREEHWNLYSLCENKVYFHKEQLYAVNSRNQVLVIDYEGNDSSDDSEGEDEVEYYEGPCVEYLISQPTEYSHVSYLVESLDGGLLLVRRRYLAIIDDINYKVTVGFKVYRMTRKHSSDEEEEPEWVEIKSLPNIALFVGDNHSICIPAFGFRNCQSNCIYFTDDCTERDPDAPYEATDMGIFHLESGQIGKHYELPQSLSYLPPAEWILPKLQ